MLLDIFCDMNPHMRIQLSPISSIIYLNVHISYIFIMLICKFFQPISIIWYSWKICVWSSSLYQFQTKSNKYRINRWNGFSSVQHPPFPSEIIVCTMYIEMYIYDSTITTCILASITYYIHILFCIYLWSHY